MTEAIHRTTRHTDTQHDGPNKVRLTKGATLTERPIIDFIEGSGMAITITDDALNNASHVTLTPTGAPPTGSAGGQLNGTYPNPGVNDTHGQTGTQTHHAQDHAVRHQPGGADAMAVDAAAATGSLRTLGTGATQAAAGTDSRFTDARTPLAHHTSHEVAGSDAVGITHAQTTGKTTDDHHAEIHTISGADHTGSITDTQHGARTVASAHRHGDLASIGTDDHHAEIHAISGADHTGSITAAQHGNLPTGDPHSQYVLDTDLTAYVPAVSVQDEGVALGSASTLNFTGAMVKADVSGGVATIKVDTDLDAMELESELAFESGGQDIGGLEWLT